ncbi:MAG: phosphotransferase [Chitinophagaceae bacterium]|nr:phosphotransferase [Chitinophagaceae bacterium]
MQSTLEKIKELFESFNDDTFQSIEKLPQSGSDRIYFRLTARENTYIATYNLNRKENHTFLAFSEHFRQYGSPVPQVYGMNEDATIYIQEDFGGVSLMDLLQQEGLSDRVYSLFQKSLKELAHIQIVGGANLNYDLCLTAKEFGKQAIMSDLLYFKYYFMDTLKYPYDKQALLDDFEALSNYLTHTSHKHFMFRDFQSRNIMVKDEKVHFIDYQGGMKGALQYDVASLLWQAKAELPDEWKSSLLEYYISYIDGTLPNPVDRITFISQYNGYVLIRLLQVLGAYGFRGLFERKAHFLTSIPLALRNLRWFVQNKHTGIELDTFNELLQFIVSDEVIGRFESVRAAPDTPLKVTVNSFSYRKGIPPDATDNGGGFVFDCRGILNPGRQEAFKILTGRDKEVMNFLEQQTKMPDFLNNVYNIIDITVEDYIKRGFESLMISFGCTGGQHRSVYAADALARHLRNKFGVKLELKHLVQDEKKWVNTL